MQCLSKTATTSKLTVETFPGVMSSDGESWFCSLKLENCKISFKLDTGAEVTVISEEAYHELQNVTPQSSFNFFEPTHKALKLLGQSNGTFQRVQKVSLQKVFVV